LYNQTEPSVRLLSTPDAYFTSYFTPESQDDFEATLAQGVADAASIVQNGGYETVLSQPGTRVDLMDFTMDDTYLYGICGHGNTNGEYFFLDQAVWPGDIYNCNLAAERIFILQGCYQYSAPWINRMSALSTRTFIGSTFYLDWYGEKSSLFVV
jgi:hypothetical protein